MVAVVYRDLLDDKEDSRALFGRFGAAWYSAGKVVGSSGFWGLKKKRKHMSTHKRSRRDGNMYIVLHHRGARPGQRRNRLLT